jgi:hypothetical protein
MSAEGEFRRDRVSWSRYAETIEGPCVVCGGQVNFVIPADRPSPAILYHSTCDVTPALRTKLKALEPSKPLPPEMTIRRAPPAAP